MTNTTNDAGPEQNHTRECLDMGWWLLHSPGTPCDPEDPEVPALPVVGDELRLTDGTTASVLQRYDATLSRVMTGQDAAWQVTGPTGARVITLDKVAGYLVDEATDVDHAAALVLNAALDWERACERGFVTEHMAAADELHKAIRAWAPLVTG